MSSYLIAYLFFFVLFWTMHVAIEKTFSLYGGVYAALNRKTQLDWVNRVVSSVHAAVTTALMAHVLILNRNGFADNLTGECSFRVNEDVLKHKYKTMNSDLLCLRGGKRTKGVSPVNVYF